ncbi:hypothetical protein [Tengunoibacter tsumagoiensis]|uniref:Uncharacterized protein n=1 Tax=Tengunoibacter tsumagoiensis TaxID=2014871 RepID=A0A402A852_9CHLR|nr:hypothetical protein [Tengunoibacter tsumagoiensis]GCE15186.1 hypothetical protein KTT_50450 [Tengunoibacter tsumagoiensis]
MLFVVMGASGAGKSTALDRLLVQHPHVVWYDFDAVGVPSTADKRWRQCTTEHWVKIALEHQSHEQDMGLCGGAVFGELLACPSTPQIAGLAGCLLDCGDVIRIDRLRGRNVHDSGISQEMLNWAAWQRMHSVDPQWRQDVIRVDAEPTLRWGHWDHWHRGDPRWNIWTFDTTPMTIDEVAKALSDWVREQKQAYAAGWNPLRGRWWEA